MPILYETWAAKQAEKSKPERRVTPQTAADAQRAQTVLDHPGYAMFQAHLAERRARIERETKAAEYTLCHRRGLTAEQMHQLRVDLASLDGWASALDMALGMLPDLVKAGTGEADPR